MYKKRLFDEKYPAELISLLAKKKLKVGDYFYEEVLNVKRFQNTLFYDNLSII